MNFLPGILGLGTVLLLDAVRMAFGDGVSTSSAAFIFLGCIVAMWRAA